MEDVTVIVMAISVSPAIPVIMSGVMMMVMMTLLIVVYLVELWLEPLLEACQFVGLSCWWLFVVSM